MGKSENKATASIADAIALTVSSYFEQKDARKEVYTTVDGFLFENLGFAKNHATTLEDKNVTPHTNVNNLEVVDEEEETGDDDGVSLLTGAAATQNNK
jgi:hypothetical protein